MNSRQVFQVTGPNAISNIRLLLATNLAAMLNRGSGIWAPSTVQAELLAAGNPNTLIAPTGTTVGGLTFALVGSQTGEVPLLTGDIYALGRDSRTIATVAGPMATIDLNSDSKTWGQMGNLAITPGGGQGFALATPGLMANGSFQDQPGYVNTSVTLHSPVAGSVSNVQQAQQVVALRPGWTKYTSSLVISWPSDNSFKYPTSAEITALETELAIGLFDVIEGTLTIDTSFQFECDTTSANQGSSNQFPIYAVCGFVDGDISLRTTSPMATIVFPPPASIMAVRLDSLDDSNAVTLNTFAASNMNVDGLLVGTVNLATTFQLSKNVNTPMFL